MLIRSIRSSFAACRFLSSSSFSENTTRAVNLNESLGRKLFRLADYSKAPDIIAKWVEEGRSIDHGEITSAIRGLINHDLRRQALSIFDSLVEHNVIKLNRQDYALHLGLIADDRGLNSAEIYFAGNIPKNMKCDITYSALLNIYVKKEETARAEALMKKMADEGFLTGPQPYIHMMSLYMSIGNPDKADEMIKEARKLIRPNIRIYNMWLIACASKNNVEAADMVFSEMKEVGVCPDWLTHSVLAGMYIRNDMLEKAVPALKEMEMLLLFGYCKFGDRKACCSLIYMLGKVGNRDEVVRIWDALKSKFIRMRDAEYGTVIAVLLRCDLCGKAEEIFSEWTALLEGGKIPKIHRTTLKLMKNAKEGKKLL